MFHEVLEELTHSPFRVYPLGNIAQTNLWDRKNEDNILSLSQTLREQKQLHGCSTVLEILVEENSKTCQFGSAK